jgi:hypothetical protein
MKFPAALLLATLLPALLHAQDATPTPAPAPSRLPIWECDLPGGKYIVAVHSIVSVSQHEYLVDGARVVEVNVDTTGNMAVRFYYLEPMTTNLPIGQGVVNTVRDAVQNAAGEVATDKPWEKVIKTYPTTTHAHTIEYRLDNEDDTAKIVNSASKALRQGISVTLKLD